MNTNVFGLVGLKYAEVCDTIGEQWRKTDWTHEHEVMDLSPILPILKHCHIKEGCTLEAIPPEHDGMSIPYVRYKGHDPLDKKKYPGITRVEELPDGYFTVDDAFEVDECPQGVWEAFLLWELDRHLPCIQHGIYGRRDYTLDLDAYPHDALLSSYVDENTGEILEEKIEEQKKKCREKKGRHSVIGYQSEADIRMGLALRGCPLLLPSVNIYAQRLYVSDFVLWSGLSRETFKFKRVNKSYGFLSLNRERLTDYSWGLIL